MAALEESELEETGFLMPNDDLLNLLTDPCQAAEDVVSRLQELERYFSSKRDLRGVFQG